jgi:primosomal protein N' (replication factor Y) (superfamily II helicase)
MGVPSIARVCVDSPLPHLDRLFDYAIPEKFNDVIDVGTRVRVPFSGRLVDAIVCSLTPGTEFAGRILEVRSAAATPSTTTVGVELARAVARRYGGSLWDVLRLAVPPRVATVEKRWVTRELGMSASSQVCLSGAYAAVEGFDRSVTVPRGERVVWEAPPTPEHGEVPVQAFVRAVVSTARSGASAVIVLPDARAVAAVADGLVAVGLRRWTAARGGEFSVVHTEDGAATRYENYLAGLRGAVPIVLGTRVAVFQPVPMLGLLALWDDGNSSFLDPHAPYPHSRTVAAMRAESEGATLVLGGWVPSIEAAALVKNRWARWIESSRDKVREEAPLVEVATGERRSGEGPGGWHWMPGAVWRQIRSALEAGPVFVVVPRTGYVSALACDTCGDWAVCGTCGGSLSISAAGGIPTCVDCHAPHPQWHCPVCHNDHLREARQGVERIAEQLMRMAPGVPVAVSSAATGTLPDGTVMTGIVVATPGALPAVRGGYAFGVVIGADTGLAHAGTEVDAARLWFAAAALVRGRGRGGRLAVVGDVEANVRRALETWTPGTLVREVVAERADLGLPPFRRVIRLEGSEEVLARASRLVLGTTHLGSHPEVTGVPSEDGTQTYVVSRRAMEAVVDAVRTLQRDLSSSGASELRLRVDGPLVLQG